jgi:hypothetical protein
MITGARTSASRAKTGGSGWPSSPITKKAETAARISAAAVSSLLAAAQVARPSCTSPSWSPAV